MFKNRKTYIVCGITILFAITQMWSGQIDLQGGIYMILTALSVAGLRNGIK